MTIWQFVLLCIQWETAQSTWQCPPTAHHPWEEVEAPALVLQQGHCTSQHCFGAFGVPMVWLASLPSTRWHYKMVSSCALSSELLKNSPNGISSQIKGQLNLPPVAGCQLAMPTGTKGCSLKPLKTNYGVSGYLL